MKVIVACESSGVVRDAFIAEGHYATSCDLLDSESAGPHIKGYIQDVDVSQYDLMIAHPPCTYLSRAGARWFGDLEREKLSEEAYYFVKWLAEQECKMIAIENPIGKLNKMWRYPDQTIQPYQFGHPYSKATCLWLKNLPKLQPTNVLEEYTPLIRSNVSARARSGVKQTGKYSG